MSEWSSGYSPGPIINGKPAMQVNPQDSLSYRVYKISKDNSSDLDYKQWPDFLGAPVDKNGNPLVLGDETLWTIYNALDSSSELAARWGKNNKKMPISPLEIHQTIFAKKGNELDNKNIFANTIFLEWTIINKGEKNIDSAYVGLWTDIDFAAFFNNPMGVDTLNQIGYCWNKNYNADKFQPSVGYVLLYGPTVPSQGDTAVFKGKDKLNYKNLPLTSFHGIEDDGTLDPIFDMANSVDEVWNLSKGYDVDGDIIIDSVSGKPTKFPLSGDPIEDSGWIFNRYTGGGAGFVMFSGPFNLAPNDTQWVMAALIPALGNNNFESIGIMREKAKILKSLLYDSLAFGINKYKVDYEFNIDTIPKVILPSEIELYQNFPNPFNPSTTIKYDVTKESFVSLKVYDILGEKVTDLVNETKPTGKYNIKFDGSNLSSGIYFYQLKVGNFIKTKKMILLR